MPLSKIIQISAPDLQEAIFAVEGTAPLVISRFNAKAKIMAEENRSKAAKPKKQTVDRDKIFREAVYTSPDGWEGFHASAIRNGLVSACRLVNFKMTLAKLSLFVIEDGWDSQEPQIPLIRIIGASERQDDWVRNPNGGATVATRAAYRKWSANIRLRWDNAQFSADDVANLLMRVGAQVGIGCGRPDSHDSAGMGWGLFKLVPAKKNK